MFKTKGGGSGPGVRGKSRGGSEPSKPPKAAEKNHHCSSWPLILLPLCSAAVFLVLFGFGGSR